MSLHKPSICIGISIGIILGIIITALIQMLILSAIGDIFTVQNMNMTIAINETQLIEAINNSRGIQP